MRCVFQPLYFSTLAWLCIGCVASSPVANDPVGGGGGGETGGPVQSSSVAVMDPYFAPALVAVAPSEVVVWNWNGSDEHNVTWVDADLPNSPTQASGSHEVRMPASPGNYGYYCSIHGTPSSGMRGSVIVEKGGATLRSEFSHRDTLQALPTPRTDIIH